MNHVLQPSFVAIPEGEFWMGPREGGMLNELPRHRVWVPAFELAAMPVTAGEFALFLEETGCARPSAWNDCGFDEPSLPATSVTWFEAAEYCVWLSKKTGREFFLPSEASREWAARGGRDVEYPWGDAPLDRTGPLPGPDRAGSSEPNAFGLFDMGGGVHEWCADWYDAAYYAISPVRDPRGPAAGVRRVSRGGSWRHALPFSRCTARSALDPAKRFTDFGFRVATR